MVQQKERVDCFAALAMTMVPGWSEAKPGDSLADGWSYPGLRFALSGLRDHFASSKIIAAPFSAIIAVGVLVLPEVIVGITEASATRRPAMP